jgi:hypothetical protein
VFVLVFSVLLTVYLIIPEGIFRFIFGWFVPAQSFVLTRTETAYRAVLVTILPFSFALALCWYLPGLRDWPLPVKQNTVQQRTMDYKIVASAFYSDTEFTKSQAEFWPAFTRCSRRQVRLVLWYFLLVALEAWILGFLASAYARFKDNPYYKWLSERFLSPYISQWHPLLTLPDTEVQADILCTNDTLYQGNVSQYFLKDGELSGIILQKPRRFNRALYLKARDEGKKHETKDYWTPIPSQHLYFFADKIVNMNLTYITVSGKIADAAAVEKFLAEEFSPLAKDLGKLSVSVVPADYRIEPSGMVVVLLSERATQRGTGAKPKQGARLAFKTRHDTAEFVRAGEAEGFMFEGKEFLADAS